MGDITHLSFFVCLRLTDEFIDELQMRRFIVMYSMK